MRRKRELFNTYHDLIGNHTKYMHPLDRIESFTFSNITKIDTKKFAKAGFFYDFNLGIIKCYFCSVKLELDWDLDLTNINPYIVHQELSPDCMFLKFAHEKRERMKTNKPKVKRNLV